MKREIEDFTNTVYHVTAVKGSVYFNSHAKKSSFLATNFF